MEGEYHVRHRRTVPEGQVAGAEARRDAFRHAGVDDRSRARQRRHRHLRRAATASTARSPSSRPSPTRDFAGLDKELGARRSAPTVDAGRQVDPCGHRGADRQARRGARGASPTLRPTSASWAPATSSRSTRKSACRATSSTRFDLADMTGTHGIGHTRMATESAVTTHRRASLLDRRRPVPRAQRLAVQPQQPAPRAEARGHDASRPRTTPKSPPPISPGSMRAGHEPRRGAGRQRSTTSTASSPSSSAPRTASAWCAIRSPASRR